MIRIETQIYIDDFTGEKITNFLLNCNNESYRNWWKGVHLQFHNVKEYPGSVGNVVYMDEYIGRRRVKMTGIVLEAVPGRRIVWKMKHVFSLPIRLVLELAPCGNGVIISHTIQAGYEGPGRIFDPFFRIFFNKEFIYSMDEHVRTEFPMLKKMLNGKS